MNVIHKLTLINMRGNRRRTVITVLGTAVAVAMITAMAVLFGTILAAVRAAAVAEYGMWHLRVRHIDERALPLLEGPNVEFIDYYCDEGFALLPGREANTRSTLAVVAYSPESYTRLPVVLSEGRLPEVHGEIVLSEDFLRSGPGSPAVGDTVELDFGYHDMYGAITRGGTGAPSDAGEHWRSEGARRFTVVGYGDLGRLESGANTSFTALTVFDSAAVPHDGLFLTACIGLREFGNVRAEGEALTGSLRAFYAGNGVADPQMRAELNYLLLGLFGAFTDNPLFIAVAVFCALLLAVILAGSVSLIGNAFSISLAERVKALGMVGSVGATRRQKRGSVWFEAAVIGLLAVPLGLVAGIAGTGVTLALLGEAFGGMFAAGTAVRLSVPWQAVVFTVLFSAFMLLLSARRPARMAAKIGPIDAVRGAHETLVAKSANAGRLARRVLGFEAAIGIRNSKRNRRRYRAILSSLVVSLVLFLVGSAAIDYMRQGAGMVQGSAAPYDVSVEVYAEPGTPFENYGRMLEFAERLRDLPGAGPSVINANYSGGSPAPEGFLTEEFLAAVPPNPEGGYYLSAELYVMDGESFARWCGQAGLPADVLRAGGGGIPAVMVSPLDGRTAGDRYVRVAATGLAAGDSFAIPMDLPGDVSTVDIAAVCPAPPDSVSGSYYFDGNANLLFVTSLEHVGGLAEAMWSGVANGPRSVWLNVQCGDAETFYREAERAAKPDGVYTLVYNMSGDNERDNRILLVVEVLTYGFVALITLVGLANIFNSVSGGMLLRAREFAVLRSCGLAPRGFNLMTDCETLFYGVRALAIGMPVSALLSWLLHRVLGSGIDVGFTLPWRAYAAALLGVFALVGVSMMYARGKLKKLNIAEAMKGEGW